jgi:hypothetical protein
MESYGILFLVGSAALLVAFSVIKTVDKYLERRRERKHREFMRRLRVYSMV